MRHLQDVAGEYGLYENNVTIIREVGPYIKMSKCRSVRKKGLESKPQEAKKRAANGSEDEKLDAAISRAKRLIKEYALCNDWDYFFSLTISRKNFADRSDLKAIYKAFGEFIHNYNRRCDDADKVKYILIPEKHKDGVNWHFHGLIRGIRQKDLFINKNGYLDWKQCGAKFGFVSLDPVRDKRRIANYITKYISKGMSRAVTEYGANLYYCSKGLETSTLIYQGTDVQMIGKWDYERPDGFCKVKWYDDLDAFAAEVRIGESSMDAAEMDICEKNALGILEKIGVCFS